MKPLILFFLLIINPPTVKAQEKKMTATLYDGIILTGYVNDGGYLNFTGPNINAVYGNSKFIVGMLPSLRFKEDKGTTKNSFVFPALGLGLTYGYRAYALQIPLYYNPKTTTDNGKWYLGIGFGLRLNQLHQNK